MASFLKIPETVAGSGGKASAASVHNDIYNVGRKTPNSVTVTFQHPQCGTLNVRTGIDQISWGYSLNTANFPTYGGEVIQILSCYVEDLRLQGTLATYHELEVVYSFFLKFIDNASAQGHRDETPMKFYYHHRGWQFDLFVKNAPGFKKGRDVVAPEWMIEAHMVDTAGDTDNLKDLIVSEAQIKAATNSTENFGLNGKIRFIDENPFSDPWTKSGPNFDQFSKVSDYYTTLLPSYLNGDFDAIFGGAGSKPAFDPSYGIKGNTENQGEGGTSQSLQKSERKGKK